MPKVLLILVLVLFLAVAEQTTGQICSLRYCRGFPISNCECKGCCWEKLKCQDGRCVKHSTFPGALPINSCFCYHCPLLARVPGGTGATPSPPVPA